MFVDRRAHKTIYEGAELATLRGATLQRFAHDDLDELESLLRADRSSARLICIDGVNSMTGNAPDLQAFARLARELRGDPLRRRRARLRRDRRAERRRDLAVRHARQQHRALRRRDLREHRPRRRALEVVLVARGVHRVPDRDEAAAEDSGAPYLYSGPSPVASLATTLAGLDVNEQRGDALRADLHAKTKRVLDALERLGIHTPNHDGFPIIEIPLGHAEQIGDVGEFLFENGIYVTLAAYPLVPRAEVGFRIQITAANTDGEVDQLIERAGRAREPIRPPACRTERRHNSMSILRPGRERAWILYLVAQAVLLGALSVRTAVQGLRRPRQRDRDRRRWSRSQAASSCTARAHASRGA